MKIFRIAAGQITPPIPGGSATENSAIQVNNWNIALPTLNSLRGIIQMANDIHAQAAKLGEELGEPGLADKVLESIQTVVSSNAQFAQLVQMGIVGSIQELFNTGVLDQKITFGTQQLQAAQQSQAEATQAQQVQIG